MCLLPLYKRETLSIHWFIHSLIRPSIGSSVQGQSMKKNKYPRVQRCVPNFAKIEKRDCERKIVKERLWKKGCEGKIVKSCSGVISIQYDYFQSFLPYQKKTHYEWTDGLMDQPMDGRTYPPKEMRGLKIENEDV